MVKRKAGKATIYKSGAKVFRPYKKAASKKSQAVTAAAVRKIIRADMGGMDTSLALTPVIATTNTNASSFVMNLIQQGTGSWNRIGRKVEHQSLRLRFAVRHQYQVDAGSSVIGNRLRMVLVWDKSPNGAAIPTYDTVFGLTDQTGAEATTLLSPIKYDNMGRFSILRDCVLNAKIEAASGTVALPLVTVNYYEVDEFVKLHGKETTYASTANPLTIADISTGALLVYFRAELNTAENFWTVNADAFGRLRYNP